MKPLRQLGYFLADRRREFISAPQLEDLQEKRLHTLMQWAGRRVPFHRERFRRAGVDPGKLRLPDDFLRLPFMHKTDCQNQPPEEWTAAGIDRAGCATVHTSGSTGAPLRLLYLRRDLTRHSLDWLRPLLAHGVRPTDRRFEITGAHNIVPEYRWYQHLGLWRRASVSIFSAVEEWLTELHRFRPDYLWGYGGALGLLARHLDGHGLHLPPLKGIFSVSDPLDAAGRALLEEQAGIIDIYGAAEGGCLAWECRACGAYHVNADHVLIEILTPDDRPAAPGECGRIVVTDLFSFAQPLIRYELGDIATWSAKAPRCGRALPLLERIEGRADATLALPDGRRLAPLFLDNILKHFPAVRHWQAEQRADHAVHLRVVPGPECDEAVLARVRQRIEQALPAPLPLHVEIVSAIPPLPSGKRCAVVSHVP